jgi:UDP-N-acetylglucosamine--N-acetylmuramyl-(pentapeptide) pyrophosphoryl-undecaprenol N-acetylglucosamine transferase
LEARPLLHFAVYGSGLGHASRAISLAQRLHSSFDSYFTSWGEGRALAERNGLPCIGVPSVDVEWGEQGRMAFKRTVRRLPRFYGSFGLQIIREMEIMKEMKPRVVISDSRLSAVVAAYRLGIPSLLITNQLRVNLPPIRGKMMRFLERVNGETLSAFWNAASLIVVPDLPPPFTISESSLESLRLPRNRLSYVGFYNGRAEKRDPESDSDGRRVFFLISGPSVSRAWVTPLMLRAARLLAKDFEVTVSLGDPNGKRTAVERDGVTVYEWCPDTEEKILEADLVVARAGHSTIAQLILAAKPAVLVPIPFHGEQWGNAQKCASLGFALAFDQLSTTPQRLAEGVRTAMNDRSMAEKARQLQAIASGRDGLENTARLILKLSKSDL